MLLLQPEEEQPDAAKELEESVTQSDLFSQLTPEDVREVIESVAKEMLGNLQVCSIVSWNLLQGMNEIFNLKHFK